MKKGQKKMKTFLLLIYKNLNMKQQAVYFLEKDAPKINQKYIEFSGEKKKLLNTILIK